MTDADLVARAAAGDVRAFLELQTRYRRYVLHTARLVGFGDRAEDAAQDVWLALLRGRWRLRPDLSGDLRRFIYVLLARMRARDARRQARIADVRIADEDREDDAVIVPIAKTLDPVDTLAERGRREMLYAAVRALPPADLALLRLRYDGDGLTLDQIAARDGRTRSAIHLHLRRIHQQLALACGVAYRTGQSPGHFRRRAGYTRRNWVRSRQRRRQAREALAS